MELEKSVIYGPVRSRRFGWDLGINLLPLDRKLCCLDCIYCQYGFTPSFLNTRFDFPSATRIITELECQLNTLEKNRQHVNHVTISGNGEPMMHPHFLEIVEKLVDWRNTKQPHLKLAVLTTGYRCGEEAIRKSLSLLDEAVVKFDTALPEKWGLINRPLVPLSFEKFKENMKQVKKLVLQTIFIKGWNDSAKDIDEWRVAIEEIKPAAVQIYTISRMPAFPTLLPVSKEFLADLAAIPFSNAIPVQAFY